MGPLTGELVEAMITDRRLGFADFVWRKGLSKWHRVSDLDEFIGLMPPYPRIGIPEEESESASSVEARATQTKPSKREVEPPPPPQAAKTAKAPISKGKPKPEVVAKPEPVAPPPPMPAKAAEPSPADIAAQVYRSALRVQAEGNAVIAGSGEFELVNVSETGIFLKSDDPPPLGEEVQMSLSLKGVDKELYMTGLVTRHGEADKCAGFAVEFTRLNPSHRRLINEFVKGRQ